MRDTLLFPELADHRLSTGATPLIPAEVIDLLRERDPLTPSQWAQQYRLVTEGPRVAAGTALPWDNDVFPPGVDIMDAAGSGQWRRVILAASPQYSGKTALAVNVLLWALHWRRQPALYMHANADKGRAQFDEKIEPALARSEALCTLIPERELYGTHSKHNFTNEAYLLVAGSQSEAELSGPTVPVVLADDVHAMPPRLGQQGHPVEVAEKRQGAFRLEERVTLCCGQITTTDNWLWRQLVASAFYVLYLPCPRCGVYQLIDFERLEYDASSPDAAALGCVLRCPQCAGAISHDELPAMLREYRWVSTPPDCDPVRAPGQRSWLATLKGEKCYPEKARPSQHAGFIWGALHYPLVPWSAHAAAYVACGTNPDALRDFSQQILARPSEPDPELTDSGQEGLSEEELKAHQQIGYRAGHVPPWADVVHVCVDVQAGYVYYRVRAWEKATGQSLLVACGTAGRPLRGADESSAEREQRRGVLITAALDEVEQLRARGFPIAGTDGQVVGQWPGERITGSIDRRYQPNVVDAWWLTRGRRRWALVMGAPAGTRAEVWPAVPKKSKRGALYRELNVTENGWTVLQCLTLPPTEEGYWHLPVDLHERTLNAYLRHLAAVVWRADLKIRRWDRRSPGLRVDYWDCECYGIGLAVRDGVRIPGHELAAAAPKRRSTIARWQAAEKR